MRLRNISRKKNNLREIEEKISYRFRDSSLLETALTHSSYSREAGAGIEYNERLEFLGDAFLDAIISEELYRLFEGREEGFLSRTRAGLVCEDALAGIARNIDLGNYLRLGAGEEKSGGRMRKSILADAFEAVVGAVFLDGGYEAAKEMILELFRELIEDARKGKFVVSDYKTALQEQLQAEGIKIENVRYLDVKQEGPDHDKVFTVALEIDGHVASEASGKSKKSAQQEAARIALMRRNNVI